MALLSLPASGGTLGAATALLLSYARISEHCRIRPNYVLKKKIRCPRNSREAKEETGLDVTLVRQFYSYSAPDRDPRQHTASTVFIATADGMSQGLDNALQAKIFNRNNLPKMVFHHEMIVDDYFSGKY